MAGSNGTTVSAPKPPPQGRVTVRDVQNPTQEHLRASAWSAAQGMLRAVGPYILDDLTRSFSGVYEQMQHAPKVFACLSTISLSVVQDGLSLRPAVDDKDHEDYAESKRHLEASERSLSALPFSIEDRLREMVMGELALGHKVAEKVYRPEESGPDAGNLVPDALTTKPRSAYSFALDDFNRLVGLAPRMSGPGAYGGYAGSGPFDPKQEPPVPRSKFVVFTHAPSDGSPLGTSLLRAAYTPWWHFMQSSGEFLKFLALCAVPIMVGEMPAGAGGVQAPSDDAGNPGEAPEAQVQEFLNKMITLHGGSAIALPPGWKINWVQAGEHGQSFLAAFDFFNREMEQAITSQNLATSEAQHGTRAHAQVHQDTLELRPAHLRRVLERDLHFQWLREWVSINHGPRAARLAPWPSLAVTEKPDWSDRATAVAALVTSGFLQPDQFPTLYEQLGLPPSEGPPPQQPGAPGQNPPPAPGGGPAPGGAPAPQPQQPAGDFLAGAGWSAADAAFAEDARGHEHAPAGSSEGGRFVPKGGGGGAAIIEVEDRPMSRWRDPGLTHYRLTAAQRAKAEAAYNSLPQAMRPARAHFIYRGSAPLSNASGFRITLNEEGLDDPAVIRHELFHVLGDERPDLISSLAGLNLYPTEHAATSYNRADPSGRQGHVESELFAQALDAVTTGDYDDWTAGDGKKMKEWAATAFGPEVLGMFAPPAGKPDALFAGLSPAGLDAEGGYAAFAKAAQQRQVGEVWQGPSGRWFTRRGSDGRTVPAKGPGGAQAGGGKAGAGAPGGGTPSEEVLQAVVVGWSDANGRARSVDFATIKGGAEAFLGRELSEGEAAAAVRQLVAEGYGGFHPPTGVPAAGASAPAAKAGRPTVEALAAELKALNRAELTPEKVKHYADTLASMSDADLNKLKAALGWGGRGGIAERAKSKGLAGKMLARATQEETDKGAGQAKAGKAAPAPSPAAKGKAEEALAKVKALDDTALDPTRSADDIRGEVAAAMKGLGAKDAQAVLDGFDISRRFPSATKAAEAVAQKIVDRRGAFDRTKINRGTKTVDAVDPSNVRPPEPDYRALGTAKGRHDARLAHEKALDEWERRRAKNAEAALRGRVKPGAAAGGGGPAAALASAFLAHPGAKANLVSVADLIDRSGLSREEAHAQIQRLRKEGVLEGVVHESRTVDPHTRGAALPPDAPGEHPMGYVAVRAGQEARLRALARGKGGAS